MGNLGVINKPDKSTKEFLEERISILTQTYNTVEKHCINLINNKPDSGNAQWRAFTILSRLHDLLEKLKERR